MIKKSKSTYLRDVHWVFRWKELYKACTWHHTFFLMFFFFEKKNHPFGGNRGSPNNRMGQITEQASKTKGNRRIVIVQIIHPLIYLMGNSSPIEHWYCGDHIFTSWSALSCWPRFVLPCKCWLWKSGSLWRFCAQLA